VNTLRDNFLLRLSSVILSSSLAFELRHLYQHGDAFLPMLPSDYRPLCSIFDWNYDEFEGRQNKDFL